MKKNLKIVFISNFFNPHQQQLSEALYEKISTYWFISTEVQPKGLLGRSIDYEPEYVLHYEKNEKACDSIIRNTDVIILSLGSVQDIIIRKCLNCRKLLFFYSERPLKNGLEPFKFIPRWFKWHLQGKEQLNHYLLCAGAFVSADFSKFGMFSNRCYKWGYYPQLRIYPDIKKKIEKKNSKEIIWCGRFIEWKHPEQALFVGERLIKEKVDFKMKMIGSGPLEKNVRKYIQEKQLSSYIELTGSISPDNVRDQMEGSGIFLFTSDRKEGWGAVLNEAMNSGCAVIASDAAGAVPYLLKDGENGMVYHSNNIEKLCEKTKYLLGHQDTQRSFGIAAYQTIMKSWNGKIAASRLLQLIEVLQSTGEPLSLFPDGPCSKAEMIPDNWFLRKHHS